MMNVFREESAGQKRLLAEEAEKIGAMPLWCFVRGIQATEEDGVDNASWECVGMKFVWLSLGRMSVWESSYRT